VTRSVVDFQNENAPLLEKIPSKTFEAEIPASLSGGGKGNDAIIVSQVRKPTSQHHGSDDIDDARDNIRNANGATSTIQTSGKSLSTVASKTMR